MQPYPHFITLLLSLMATVSVGNIAAQVETILPELLLHDNEDEITQDHNVWMDHISDLTYNKMDINKVSENDLMDLGILNSIQVYNILTYRDELGPFINILELQAIPGISINEAKLMSQLLSVNRADQKPINLKKRAFGGSHKFLLKWAAVIEAQRGYLDKDTSRQSYIGDKNAILMKWQYSAGKNTKIGFIIEKDPGEPLFNYSNGGFDHLGFYVSSGRLTQTLENLILGDFRVNMGQGLICHSSYLSSKSALVLNLSKNGSTFKTHSSISETGFKRGIAASFKFKNVFFDIYLSGFSIDSKLVSDSLPVEMSSLNVTGLHRTESEIEGKSNQMHYSTGSAISYSRRFLDLGINIKYDLFQYPFEKTEKLHQLFRPASRSFLNISLDHRFKVLNAYFSGELAFSDHGGMAIVQSGQFSLSKQFDVGLLFRKYNTHFYSLEGAAFGNSTSVSNEKGFYIGSIFKPHRGWKFSAYLDLWTFPWLKYNIDAPTLGYEYFCKMEYYQKRKLSSYFQLRRKMKQINSNDSQNGIKNIVSELSTDLRFHVNFKLTKAVELRSRMEFKFSGGFREHGFLIYQDLIYSSLDRPYSFSLRYALYDTPDSIKGFYAYERDVLNSFGLSSYSKSGVRLYLNLRYKLGRIFTMELRYARSFYPFESSFSSGNDLIESNHKSSIKAQLSFKF